MADTQQTTQTQAQTGEATTQPGTRTQGAQQNQATSTASPSWMITVEAPEAAAQETD